MDIAAGPLGASPVRAGFYRVLWTVDLPKEEFETALQAARAAQQLAAEPSCIVNVFDVLDGDSQQWSAHDLAP